MNPNGIKGLNHMMTKGSIISDSCKKRQFGWIEECPFKSVTHFFLKTSPLGKKDSAYNYSQT